MSALTREQIKAMRAADAAVLRFDLRRTADAIEQTNTLELHKEVQRPDGFGSETLRVHINALALVRNYGADRYSDDEESYALARAIRGDWVLLSLHARPDWQTLAGFVRPGDALTQEWTIDNRNTLLKRAHLTLHELAIGVQRPTRNGNAKIYTFNLDARVEDPNSLSASVERES